MQERHRIDLCATDDVAEGEIRKVEAEGLTVAVYNVAGEFYVTDDHCTHGPGSLSEGWLDGYEIECDFHQGHFDVRTGEVMSPPPVVPIRTYQASVQDGRIVIELNGADGTVS